MYNSRGECAIIAETTIAFTSELVNSQLKVKYYFVVLVVLENLLVVFETLGVDFRSMTAGF
jgi:hypothetical protein